MIEKLRTIVFFYHSNKYIFYIALKFFISIFSILIIWNYSSKGRPKTRERVSSTLPYFVKYIALYSFL